MNKKDILQDTLIDQKIDQKIEETRIKSKLSSKTLAHLETLKSFMQVDMHKRIVTIPLHYHDIYEIVDDSLGDIKHPVIKRDILSKISDLAHSVPYEFKINVDLKIDNYGKYKHNNINKAILDAFALFQFDVTREKRISALKVSLLVVIGVVILAWLFYLCSKHLIGQQGDPTHDTVHEIIYTVGAVVLWEAIYIIFLPSNDYKDISYEILYRINKISLLNNKDNVLSSIDATTMNQSWWVDTRKQHRSRKALLVAGTGLICVAGVRFVDVAELFIKFGDKSIVIPSAIILITIILFSIIAGLGAISYYRDKGPFQRWVRIFGIIALILSATELIFTIVLYKQLSSIAPKAIVLSSLTLAISIIYIICSSILLVKKRKDKRIIKSM